MARVNCPRCDGVGVVPDWDANGVEFVRRCECDPIDYLAAAGVPPLERSLLEATLPEHARKPMAEARYAVAHHESVYFVGPVGRGKSGISVILMRDAVANGRTVGWCNVLSWLRQVRSSYDTIDPEVGRLSETTLLRSVVEPDFLVVDDLAAHRMTDWSANMIEALVMERDSSARQTVYSSNLTLDGSGRDTVRSVYGERVWSRLGRCRRVVMTDGPDMRRAGDEPSVVVATTEPEPEVVPVDKETARRALAEMRRRLNEAQGDPA